jgi:hypothetical protein
MSNINDLFEAECGKFLLNASRITLKFRNSEIDYDMFRTEMRDEVESLIQKESILVRTGKL